MFVEAVICLALNLYHEGRGEPVQGRKAILEVTLNRADWQIENICPTVFKPAQFSWTLRNPSTWEPLEEAAWERSKTEAAQALEWVSNGRGPQLEATHYHTKAVRPVWRKSLEVVAVIGNHIFYR